MIHVKVLRVKSVKRTLKPRVLDEIPERLLKGKAIKNNVK
jgi:hypothetical protein